MQRTTCHIRVWFIIPISCAFPWTTVSEEMDFYHAGLRDRTTELYLQQYSLIMG